MQTNPATATHPEIAAPDTAADHGVVDRIITRSPGARPIARPRLAPATPDQIRAAELEQSNRFFCSVIARQQAKIVQLATAFAAVDDAQRELRRIPQAEIDRLRAYAEDTGRHDADFLPWPNKPTQAQAAHDAAVDAAIAAGNLPAAMAALDTLIAADLSYHAEGLTPPDDFLAQLKAASQRVARLARAAGAAPSAEIDDDTIEALFGPDDAGGADGDA